MKDSATDATESDKFVSDFLVEDVRRNVRCRDWMENPSVDVNGLGQGIRAVTEPMDPS